MSNSEVTIAISTSKVWIEIVVPSYDSWEYDGCEGCPRVGVLGEGRGYDVLHFLPLPPLTNALDITLPEMLKGETKQTKLHIHSHANSLAISTDNFSLIFLYLIYNYDYDLIHNLIQKQWPFI